MNKFICRLSLILIVSFLKINCTNNNGSFKTDKENSFLKLVVQSHINRRRNIRPSHGLIQYQSNQEALVLKQASNTDFVDNYKCYKNYSGAKYKIKEVIFGKDNELVKRLATQLNDEHLLIFFKDVCDFLPNYKYEKWENRFLKSCSNDKLLNNLTIDERNSVLEFKKLVEKSWQLAELNKVGIDFNLNFYECNNFNYHERILNAAKEIRSNDALKDYTNAHRHCTVNVILSAANRITYGRNSQSLRCIIDKPNLTVQEENTLLEQYRYYKGSPDWLNISKFNPNFYIQLESKAQDIDYNQNFDTLDTNILTDAQKTSYLDAKKRYNQWRKVNGLISSNEEFSRIYNLAHQKNLDPKKLTPKEVQQCLYVLALKNFNTTTIGLISEGKIDLAFQSLSAAECFYDFASGAAKESVEQLGIYIMSQPARALIVAGGCAFAPLGGSYVTAYYLTLYAYTVYSSYGILKEDIVKAIDAYQNDDYYELGRVSVKTATDAVILKSIGNTIRNGYKLAKLKNNSKEIKKGVELGLATGERVQVFECKVSKLNETVDKVASKVKNSNINLKNCHICPMQNINPKKQHFSNYKDISVSGKYKKHVGTYLNKAIKENPPPEEIGTVFKFKRPEHNILFEVSCEIDKDTGIRNLKIVGGHLLSETLQNNPKFKLNKVNNFPSGGFEGYINYNGIESKIKSFFPEGTTPEQSIDFLVESLNNPIKIIPLARNKVEITGVSIIGGVKTAVVSILTCSKDGKVIESFYPDYTYKT